MNIRPGFRRRRPTLPLVLGDPAPAPPHRIELRAFRWQDLEPMMEIERRSIPAPFSELQMRHVLDRSSVVCTIAERSGSVAGFAIHSYGDVTIRLLSVAVHPAARRLGVGRALMGRVRRSLGIGRWVRIETMIPLEAVGPLLWLREMGFVAVPDLKGRFVGPDEIVRLMHEASSAGMDTGCGGEGRGDE